MRTLNRTHRLIALVSATALIAVPALAAPANGLQDLVGARGAGGETQLTNRGYVNISSHPDDGGIVSYWWNNADRACAQVVTRDGRYAELNRTTPGDCNQRDRGGNTGAAVAAVGAAAMIGALLVSHRSHHHDDNNHANVQAANAQADEAQFERGYQDGIHNVAYHNYDRADAYSRGYESGVEQRGHNTSYRNSSGNRAGYRPSVNVTDLNGTDSVRAIDAMGERGFANVDSIVSGNSIYGIWYNRTTRQCVQTASANGTIVDARDIGTHPNCR
jgi:hypothetical protein